MDQVNSTQTNPSDDNPFQPYAPPPPPPPSPSEATVVVQEKPKKSSLGKTVLILGFSVLVLGGLVFGAYRFSGLFSKAAGSNCEPQNIQEGSLTANSVEITFQTTKACLTKITYGTSGQPEALLLEMPEAMASLNHRFKLSPLLPSTTYYYQINADDKPVGTIRNTLTLKTEGSVENETPPPPLPDTISETPPASVGSGSSSSERWTFEDFQEYFGTNNSTFDLNKDRVVNFADWNIYQKTR